MSLVSWGVGLVGGQEGSLGELEHILGEPWRVFPAAANRSLLWAATQKDQRPPQAHSPKLH